MEKEKLIRVYGIVQGVGFRPFVSRIADENEIKGSVCNKGPYVEIFAKSEDVKLEKFIVDLRQKAPKRSAILKIEEKEIEVDKSTKFQIIKSKKVKGDVYVSPDIAICPDCQRELFDKNNKRYLHPFINCTACGPRLTILDSMPYDRVRTSMGAFPMCKECEYEYTTPTTRRYHAQPVCCNDCGPKLYIVGKEIYDKDALIYTRKLLREGKIAAIKGIGGFHLCVDARNKEAVQRLRDLKKRPKKPFALMMKNMETVEKECITSSLQRDILEGPQKPIILLEKRKDSSLCDEIAPKNPSVGVMLPYAPVQLLLFDYPDGEEMTDCFVMTSANVSGAPICRTDEDAIKEISNMCDVILSNDRTIRLRADDSVMSFYDDKPYMIRRSRGYAPLPVMLGKEYKGKVLAIGGELKSTFCVGSNSLFYLSPYVGDLEDIRSVKALEFAIGRLSSLLEVEPSLVTCDLHPRYNSTLLAEKIAKEKGIEILKIQHHYAHIASCMAENDISQKVIGVSFDGTGYGTDNTIWGGEFLVADFLGFERVAKIKPFKQAGGDASSKEGYRIAVSMIDSIFGREKTKEISDALGLCDDKTLKVLYMMLDNNINTVKSTSAGRLFDGVSAILGIKKASTFEGEASMSLEFAAKSYEKDVLRNQKEIEIDALKNELKNFENKEVYELETDILVKELVERKLNGEDSQKLAYDFHVKLSKLIIKSCLMIKEKTGLNIVALSGGVFQNLLLLRLCDKGLSKLGFKVLKHSLIPANDGGIALGQAVIAMNYLERSVSNPPLQKRKL
ncbi:Hydrogenase maturation protein, carbamoyltransferase HypF [Acetitomaculum ruminis DSM 5522]|uniref:Carbamoyltransferase n=1 Tax=Acetitomaculum ruminis DSM 5522 TaxID=1120918 RepID=A0A1I0Z756_9FIRM|nr:carbamoyltransferase HypF [Acetitomaculum ruminis]SFB21242.1 Hydrogenase maturation protein, carbamoyltransferase HypF [Acetitomaculum ruminis DSM 5522]